MPVLICLRERLWTRTYSIRDQVPTCPVFTRAKIKPRSGIKVKFSRHTIYFLVVFKTVLRGLWMFGFVGHKIVFWVLFVELGGLLTPFSLPALFSHISPHGDLSHLCSSGCAGLTSTSLCPKSRAQVPYILPSPSASLHPGTQPSWG